MSELIYCHRGRKEIYADKEGSAPYTFADFVAGETRDFALRFLRTSAEGSTYEEYPNVKSITASIGLIDQRPTSGTLKYWIGNDVSTAANTTAALPHNHNASALQAAINALAGIVAALGVCEVQLVPGGFEIHWPLATGPVQIRAKANRLEPLTIVRTFAQEIDGDWLQEVRLVQAQLETTSTWLRVMPPSPTTVLIQQGGYDNSGQFPQPTIQRLNMPPEFLGTYQLRRADNEAVTALLDRADDPETIVRDAIRAIFDEEGITVELFENYALITFGGGLNGADVGLLEVVPGEAPPGDPTFSLDLKRPTVYRALRDRTEATASFEIRAYIAADDATEEDAGKPVVLCRREVRLLRDQNFDGAEALIPPPWNRPPNAIDYTPTTPDQIQSGIAWWEGVKGNGVATVIPCDHGMDTESIFRPVAVDNTTGEAREDFTWAVTNANTVTLTFATAPAENGVRITLAGAIPVSQWEPHTHTIAQVVGLLAILDAHAGSIALLMALLPRAGAAGAASGLSNVEFELPPIGEVLADAATLDTSTTLASQVVVVEPGKAPQAPAGTDVAAEQDRQATEQANAERDSDALPASVIYRAVIPAVGRVAQRAVAAVRDGQGEVVEPEIPAVEANPIVWPTVLANGKAPLLLPAVEAAAATDVTELPAMAAGTVWRWTGAGSLLLPGGYGRRSQTVGENGYFAGDGRAYYRVRRDGETDWWFAEEMERELWRVYLGEVQFPDNSELRASGELRMRLVGESFDAAARGLSRVVLGGQYVLVCEAVPVAGATVAGAEGETAILGATRLTLSPMLESMRWEVRVRREGGSVSSSWLAYRQAQAGAGFAGPATLRLRLVNFDVDDASADARGQVALVMPQTSVEVRAL